MTMGVACPKLRKAKNQELFAVPSRRGKLAYIGKEERPAERKTLGKRTNERNNQTPIRMPDNSPGASEKGKGKKTLWRGRIKPGKKTLDQPGSGSFLTSIE